MIGANTTITTYRIVRDANDKEAYSASPTLTSVSAWVEQLDQEPTEFVSGDSTYYNFRCYVDGILDVKISDKVIDGDGYEYTVKGVQAYNGGDVPDHTEISMTIKRNDYI